MTKTRFLVVTAAAVFFIVVPVVSASATSKPTPSVMVIGDSITYLSTSEIQTALTADGYRATVDGIEGTTIVSHLPTIRNIVKTQPRQDWVVELGTNDVRFNPEWPKGYAAEIRILKSQRCVVLVTVNPRIGQQALELDSDIAHTVAIRHHFHSLDWGDIEWNNPSWVSDGIHPTSAGSAELAQLESQALNADCPA